MAVIDRHRTSALLCRHVLVLFLVDSWQHHVHWNCWPKRRQQRRQHPQTPINQISGTPDNDDTCRLLARITTILCRHRWRWRSATPILSIGPSILHPLCISFSQFWSGSVWIPRLLYALMKPTLEISIRELPPLAGFSALPDKAHRICERQRIPFHIEEPIPPPL